MLILVADRFSHLDYALPILFGVGSFLFLRGALLSVL